MEWNVYVGDFNTRRIKEHNVFDHWGIREDLQKALKKCEDRESFEEEVRKALMYRYWSKCEWEVVIDHWPPFKEHQGAEKVDVYDQIMMNWKIFTDYLWENRDEIKKWGKK